MTVSTEIIMHSYYPGDAMAEELIPFQFLDADHVTVNVVGNADALVAGTDYVITGDGRARAAKIRTLRVFPADEQLRLLRVTAMRQDAITDPFKPLPAEQVGRELDRRAMIEQELGSEVGRSLQVPLGEAGPTLPSVSERAGKFLVGLPGGGIGASNGGGADDALREDLAAPGGSGYVNFRHAGAGAQPRPSEEKLRDTVDAKDFGALGDSANDDYPAIMAALAAHGRVHLSHSATNHYMVSQPIHLTDGQVLTSDLGVTIFGTGVNGALLLTGGQICVDVGQVVAPAAQYCVRYYDLVWSVVRIRRAGLCSKAVFFMDGDAQTANAGVNEWHIGDIQAGSCEYGVWLKNSPTKTYEGDVWRIRCILSATVCMLKIGETPAAHTLRWNEFHLAVDAQGITPLLIDFNQDQNHVILYNWAGIVGPPVAHVTFNALVGGNRLDSFPGIQDPLIVRDFGFNTWEAQGQAGNKSVGAVTTFGYISGTGLEIVNVENKSKANVATKYVGFGFFGRDTADSGKNVAVVRAVPLDGDWVNSLLELHFRRNDALTRAAAFGDKTVLFDRLQSLNYASDAAASAGGVPIGGLYHNAGAVRIRLA